jgi:hypothetical protein
MWENIKYLAFSTADAKKKGGTPYLLPDQGKLKQYFTVQSKRV